MRAFRSPQSILLPYPGCSPVVSPPETFSLFPSLPRGCDLPFSSPWCLSIYSGRAGVHPVFCLSLAQRVGFEPTSPPLQRGPTLTGLPHFIEAASDNSWPPRQRGSSFEVRTTSELQVLGTVRGLTTGVVFIKSLQLLWAGPYCPLPLVQCGFMVPADSKTTVLPENPSLARSELHQSAASFSIK